MQRQNNEFYFQIISLLLSVIIVHSVYVILVRPAAQHEMQLAVAAAEETGAFEVPRTLPIVIKDFEQEACFILMLWSLAIIGFKLRQVGRERLLLHLQINGLDKDARVLPEDAVQLIRPFDALPLEQRRGLLPRTLRLALARFSVTGSVQSATDAVIENCNNENDRLDSELSMVRYITWAIPSIGFIGTVRGIGAALGMAHEAVQGDIAGVTSALGVAFNSTFVALLISMIVMLFMHQLQQMQERLVLDAKEFSENHLLSHLKVVRD
ncbi:MAG: MotA/TolQ/ExbB proton channel family protein [Halioglobus sp.]